MNRVSRKKFLEITGIARTSIPAYKKRGNIIIDDDGMIDLDNPINQQFIMSRDLVQDNRRTSNPVENPVDDVEYITPIEQAINDKEVERSFGGADEFDKAKLNESYTLIEANRKKAELDVKLKEEDLVKKRLENERKRGEALPTEFVVDLVKSVSEGLRNSYHDATENVILLIGHRTKMTNDDTSYVKKQLNSVINKSVDDGYDEAFKTIEALAKEYGDKRGVGQSI